MTFTITQDDFTFNSSQIQVSNTASYFKWGLNCGTLSGAVDISTASQSFVVEPSDLGLTEFSTGVYKFVLSNVASTGVLTEETVCFYFEKTGDCSYFKYYKEKDFEKIMAHLALKASVECKSCNCQDLCDLKTFLDGTNNTCNACCCGM